jgi:glycosyltransferase involved in cell wall biosynthesis
MPRNRRPPTSAGGHGTPAERPITRPSTERGSPPDTPAPVPGRQKVCHIITRLIVGGAQENTILSCALLDPTRYETFLVTGPETGPEGELHSEARRLRVRVIVVPSLVREVSFLKDARTLLALWRLLRAERPDVVHTHSSKAGVLGRTAAWLARVPVIVHTVHGWGFHDHMSKMARRSYVWIERLMAHVTRRLIVVSRRDRDRGLELGIGSSSHYVMIRSGVDLSAFRTHPRDRAAIRAALAIPPAASVVGSVTRLSAQKDPDTLLRAAALVARKQPDVYFVVVGDGPLRPDLERLTDRLGLRDRIRFTGIYRDIPAVMSAFDVFVLTSLWEGLPRVVPEAIAAGLPIVASSVDNLAEILEEGTGLLVPPGAVQPLADGILRLLADPELAQTLVEKARGRVEEFDLSVMISRLDELYRHLSGIDASALDAPSTRRSA